MCECDFFLKIFKYEIMALLFEILQEINIYKSEVCTIFTYSKFILIKNYLGKISSHICSIFTNTNSNLN